MKKPWVSFCMSTYKRADFLEKQIKCLLEQSFADFEIVISDNDPDGSGKVAVDKFNDSRINYEINPVNLGMVKSFNHSLSRSSGDFIVMITDDDPVYPDMLQTLHDLTKSYPGYGVYQGGCEILCYTKEGAEAMRAKVGMNSCLSSEMNLNEIKTYSAEEFPHLFFNGNIGNLLLWSCGIVRRDIILQNGGMPDYGTEFFTDHAYNVANCSHSGVVYINKSLGYQAIHGGNFGFNQLKNLDKYVIIPDAFGNWLSAKLQSRKDWPSLKIKMQAFIGRSLTEFSFFIKKSLEKGNHSLTDFQKALKLVYAKPYLRKWKLKYYLMTTFPATFQFVLSLKNKKV